MTQIKEIPRQVPSKCSSTMLTGRLVSGMPYLRSDSSNPKKFTISYWIELFNPRGEWTGSNWFKDQQRKDHDNEICDYPNGRIWELPGLKYPKPNTLLRKYLEAGKHDGKITDPSKRRKRAAP